MGRESLSNYIMLSLTAGEGETLCRCGGAEIIPLYVKKGKEGKNNDRKRNDELLRKLPGRMKVGGGILIIDYSQSIIVEMIIAIVLSIVVTEIRKRLQWYGLMYSHQGRRRLEITWFQECVKGREGRREKRGRKVVEEVV